jgi:hypothetical protein
MRMAHSTAQADLEDLIAVAYFCVVGLPGAPSCSETGTALNSRTNTAESLVEWRAEAVGTSGGESHGRVCAEPRRLGA